MGAVWRNGKIVGTTKLWHNDDEPFGYGIGTPKCAGIGQALIGVKDFADADERILQIGPDKRVYGRRHGLIECWAHVKPTTEEPNVYVDRIDWTGCPPEGELAWLFRHFFSQYKDREVVMLVGYRRDGQGHLYHVPEQVGTCGDVKWDADDEEMGRFQDQARWIGTIHSHPGNCAGPSQTDIDDWANPEKSGLHVILGRDGSYTVNGAIAERTFTVFKGDLCGTVSAKTVRYSTSKGRSLTKLLKKPKPTVVKRSVSRGVVTWVGPKKRQRVYSQPLDGGVDDDYVEEALGVLGALSLDQDNGLPTMYLVWYNERVYAMTTRQHRELTEWCHDVCPIPRSKKVRLFSSRGGGR
jgi:proteasome lid subunit RPN8/RPN11